MRDLQLSKYNTLLLFEETRQELHNPSCFDFSSEFDVLLFDFSPAEFFDCTYYLNDWKQPFTVVEEK